MLALAVFCLRLAFGMIACLGLLAPRLVNPRFYRTHFLTVLGLTCLVLLAVQESGGGSLLALLSVALVAAFAGSITWSLEGAPGGRLLTVLTAALLGSALALLEKMDAGGQPLGLVLLGGFSSALLLGSAISAMLMGHSYLIAPSMSLRPLLRLLTLVALVVVARMLVDGYALERWTRQHSLANLGNDLRLWLPLRWLLGFVGPLGLDWMAWQAARIRATQSATGILYVVVIFCFLGELTGQLLRGSGVTL